MRLSCTTERSPKRFPPPGDLNRGTGSHAQRLFHCSALMRVYKYFFKGTTCQALHEVAEQLLANYDFVPINHANSTTVCHSWGIISYRNHVLWVKCS